MKSCDLCGAPQEDALCESCDPFHGNRGKQFQAARRAIERVRKEAWEAGRATCERAATDCYQADGQEGGYDSDAAESALRVVKAICALTPPGDDGKGST